MFFVYVYRVIQTQCLGGLLTYFSSNENTVAASFDEMPTIQRLIFQWLNMGYVHAAGIVLCSLFSIVINNEFNMYTARLGMQIRAICGSLLYRQVYITMSYNRTPISTIYYSSSLSVSQLHLTLSFVLFLIFYHLRIDIENVQINFIRWIWWVDYQCYINRPNNIRSMASKYPFTLERTC